MSTTGEAELQKWFAERIDESWFTALAVRYDKDEIQVVGTVKKKVDVGAWRESTREARIVVASEAERLFGRKVSWCVRQGDDEHRFTVANVPVMTRLLYDERGVLDTLIDAGIARSRSEALAWCVKLVGANQAEWIEQLREAIGTVEKVRAEGPDV